MSDADAGADADADIQLLRCPETLTQLYDIVTYPFGGQWDHSRYCHDYKRMANLAVTKGRGVSPELWAAGMWAITRLGNATIRSAALAIITPEVRANECGDYICLTEHQAKDPAWVLLQISYMIAPKDSLVIPLILYSLARWLIWAPQAAAQVAIQASPGGEPVTVNSDDLLAAVLNHPTATARLRASVICTQAREQGFSTSIELLYQAHETDLTYITVYTYLSYYMDAVGVRVIRLGSRLLNRWGLALEAVINVVGLKGAIYGKVLVCGVPELDGTSISLGDSSMSVFDYICALETPDGSVFCPEMLTDMLPADTPWSCRRHEALDRRTGANALFATFLCALARLELPGGPLRPSHQTMWEHALESWTLGDSAVIYASPSPSEY